MEAITKKAEARDTHYEHMQRETKLDRPCGLIQWKGTDVCIDLHCACGAHFHVDDSFTYFVMCPNCKQIFGLGEYVKMVPLTDPDEVEYALGCACGIKTGDDYSIYEGIW